MSVLVESEGGVNVLGEREGGVSVLGRGREVCVYWRRGSEV